ncbi:unnamed protein product, partial [Brenthis ino]
MADENRDFIKSFESSLQLQNKKKVIPLYQENKTCKSNIIKLSAKEVILNVSQQMKAIQIADSIRKVCNKSELNMYKKNDFVPLHTLTTDEQPKQTQYNKFDTQCVSDTQLINIVEHAEALMDVPKDIGLEFDTVFCDQNIALERRSQVTTDKCPNIDKSNLKLFNNNCLNNNEIANINEGESDQQNFFAEIFQYESCTLKELARAHSKDIDLDLQEFTEDRKSPILNNVHSPIVKSKSSSPLVFGLETFEKFETIAMPVIEENHDIETAKKIINSQIISKELYTQSHVEPVLCDRDKSLSPILKIKKKNVENVKNDTITKVQNGILTVEDNVLFSSDEEDDINKNKELPLTCALETSFYNEQDLDKTMYVGFQTASNKSIQICSESYNKARSILDDSINDIPLIKLVEVIDNSYNNIEEEKSLNQRNKNENLILNTIDLKKVHTNSLDITQKDFVNSKIVSNNSNFNKDNKQHESGFEDVVITLSNNKTRLSQTLCVKDDKNVKDESIILCQKHVYNKSDDVRFNTECTKEQICPTEQLNIDDQILKEFETNFVVESNYNNNEIGMVIKSTSDIENVNKDYSSDRTVACNVKYEGFKTANNKEIKLSAHGLAKIKNIFEDIDLTDIQFDMDLDNCKKNFINYNINEPSTSKGCMGFEIATNKQIDVSGISLKKPVNHDIKKLNVLDKFNNKAKNININWTNIKPVLNKTYPKLIREDSDLYTDLIYNKNNNKGEKDINVCNETSDLDGNNEIPTFIGFQTASNKPVMISNKALAKSKILFQDIEKDTILDCKSDLSDKFKGFQTASNKLIPISKNALVKSKKILDSVDKICDMDILYPTENIENCKQSEEDIVGLNETSNTETTTEISEKAVAVTKDVFQNMNVKDNKSGNTIRQTSNSNTVSHFKTTSNESVTISNEALIQNRNIIEDKENKNVSFEENKPYTKNNMAQFQGLKTASNKSVKISDNSLRKSRQIFQDMDITDSNYNNIPENKSMSKPSFQGFQTASSKPVHISKAALDKTKYIFKDIDESSNTKMNTNTFVGFKTASDKFVKISEDALSKSRKIFQDMDVGESFDCNMGNKPKELSAFEGFKTASLKPVSISEDAFAKTKSIFKDLNESIDKINTNPSKNNAFAGFQTASNKKVKISEEALLKSRKVFEDMNFNNEQKVKSDDSVFKEPINKSRKLLADIDNNKVPDNAINNRENLDLEDLINTEVIKDLEETLYTEDFYKEETPKCKRSGSPILSCPKAKKRKKNEMPKTVRQINSSGDTDNTRTNNLYTFDENYKKNKCLNLQNVIEIEKISTSEVVIDPFISNFRFDTLFKFEFAGKRNDIDNDTWNIVKIKKLFTDSVNKKIIPEGWIDNHIKLIIWKLLSYEICFPKTMNNICTIKNVLHQLKYRYDRELYNVERPALRKILEKDEVSIKKIVLCVVAIYVEGVNVSSVANPAQNAEVLLTDGWYTIKACTDRMINKLICDGKITIGTKLLIHGAELTNCDQGVSPWEDTSAVRLKIFGNSIRRAKWDTRLGFHGNGAILSHLSSVRPEGGKISRLKVFVARVYPTLYVEKFEDGSTVTRSERLENQYQMKFENERQFQLEKLYEEVEKYSDKESQDSEGLDIEKESFESGSQICKMMKRSRDPSELRAALTESQVHLLQEHASKKREKLIENLQKKIQDLVKKRGLNVNRNVVTLLKLRVADVKNENIIKAMITIWRPNECLIDLIKEGTWIEMYNVVPTAVRYSEIQISAGRQSIFKMSKIKETDKIKSQVQSLKRKSYTIKDLQTPLTTDYNEIDTCGFIFLIEPLNKDYDSTKQLFQNVYLADENKNIIAINFWGGLKKFGFENILDTGQIVSCVNLQKRHGNTKKCIPQFRATEFTYFTKTCKIDHLRLMTEELCNKYSSLDKRKYIEDCVAIKNNFANTKYGNTENISPYRLNNSDYNLTKNKVFIDSPTVNKCTDENLNLTGLDFESTFRLTDTQELSPKTMLRKKKLNEKIAKLEMYGEPPPLKPIHIINKSNIIHNSYKSPLCNSVASVVRKSVNSVASVEKISENISSPLLNNRTFVKNINPVKLNFSHTIETEDPFAEEFDCSPPLSLD